MHCFRTYFIIQNPIVPTEPVFGSLPFSKPVLQVFVGDGTRTKFRVTSDNFSTFVVVCERLMILVLNVFGHFCMIKVWVELLYNYLKDRKYLKYDLGPRWRCWPIWIGYWSIHVEYKCFTEVYILFTGFGFVQVLGSTCQIFLKRVYYLNMFLLKF